MIEGGDAVAEGHGQADVAGGLVIGKSGRADGRALDGLILRIAGVKIQPQHIADVVGDDVAAAEVVEVFQCLHGHRVAEVGAVVDRAVTAAHRRAVDVHLRRHRKIVRGGIRCSGGKDRQRHRAQADAEQKHRCQHCQFFPLSMSLKKVSFSSFPPVSLHRRHVTFRIFLFSELFSFAFDFYYNMRMPVKHS